MSLNLEGSTALDIGANKGIYCYWLSKAVGPSGHVLAFEPQPEMVDYIGRRGRHFLNDNVRVIPTGLSNRIESATLLRDYAGHGSASLDHDRKTSCSQELLVTLKRLDDFGRIESLKFIKCDIEGHELAAFEGAKLTLRDHLPVVQFESVVANAPRLFEFFLSLGYSGLMFFDDGYRPLSAMKTTAHYKFGMEGHRDFLFFHPETAHKIIPGHLLGKFHKAIA